MHPLAIHRGRAGLSQTELGRHVGTTGQHVGDWERATYMPSAQYVVRLADALGVNVNTLHAELIAAKEKHDAETRNDE